MEKGSEKREWNEGWGIGRKNGGVERDYGRGKSERKKRVDEERQREKRENKEERQRDA